MGAPTGILFSLPDEGARPIARVSRSNKITVIFGRKIRKQHRGKTSCRQCEHEELKGSKCKLRMTLNLEPGDQAYLD